VHIFALNDWADYAIDRRLHSPDNAIRTNRDSLLLVSIVSLGGCAFLLWSVSPPALVPVACVVVASAVYSLQWPIRGKEVLFLSSALHAICAAACFIIGLDVAAASLTRWSSLLVFLLLSVPAGHLYQEMADHREDVASHTRTHATVLGPQKTFFLGQVLFAAAFFALLTIPHDGAGFLFFQLLIVVAWLANLGVASICWRRGLTPESVQHYRLSYRWIYGAIVVGLILRAPAIQRLMGL
jgi:4-hydroxybenzoate polyprenyltransferase